jgi:CO/xanthine dehydrogenase FAD-binding subunit
MMRLPPFSYRAPDSAEEVVQILAGEGPAALVVAGGTDLYPNMKRRQHMPETVVSLRNVAALKGIEWREDGSVRIGAGETLRALERNGELKQRLPALWDAVVSISTPILRNMATIGGNLCLDTRCYYLNQNFEWRRAINHCLKCGGDTCWTAPGSEKCWAVNSSDSVPVMIAMDAKFTLLGPGGEREVSAAEMYDISDGREWLTPPRGLRLSRTGRRRPHGEEEGPGEAIRHRAQRRWTCTGTVHRRGGRAQRQEAGRRDHSRGHPSGPADGETPRQHRSHAQLAQEDGAGLRAARPGGAANLVMISARFGPVRLRQARRMC